MTRLGVRVRCVGHVLAVMFLFMTQPAYAQVSCRSLFASPGAEISARLASSFPDVLIGRNTDGKFAAVIDNAFSTFGTPSEMIKVLTDRMGSKLDGAQSLRLQFEDSVDAEEAVNIVSSLRLEVAGRALAVEGVALAGGSGGPPLPVGPTSAAAPASEPSGSGSGRPVGSTQVTSQSNSVSSKPPSAGPGSSRPKGQEVARS